ncbi:PREDICTED: putative disease resistance protein At3g14460 [Tarenaya hassleriana]|uniref:putative disease resistance protein At3g14460 n=1 Tax=Tarenaya hassleriana TaxID=28532 RepID=UPI00053C1759|nr:PREDICTED: putative disease resistance protein At3g14460 [Tarenaya hassleriana]
MAVSPLSQCVNVMLDRINTSRELLEFFRGQSFNSLLRRLKTALVTANSVLADAEQKAEHVREVRNWLTELKDAFFLAEDVLDEISTEALRRRVVAEEGGIGGRIRNLMVGREGLQKNMETEMLEVVRRLEYHVKHIEVMGLRDYSGALAPPQRQRSPSSPDLPLHRVIGWEEDKVAFLKLLLSEVEVDNGKPGVIPIVGMPGIGKTTFAQVVYNDSNVTEHFDHKVWIFVGETFDVLRVTKSVLHEITSGAVNTEDLPSLQVQLKESLSGKRFLLILDDFWAESNSEWENFLVSLADGQKGSKIILTTRSEIVCAITQTAQSYPLKLMSDEECWELISRSVFDRELEGIGKKIAKQCKGLPLAAKAIASHLRSKPNHEEWYAVSKNFSSYTSHILPVLKWSFDYLPSRLKRCFAFCSIFPKGYVFNREKLVLLWLAIDLLYQPGSNKRLEDIGDEYINELVARSFLRPLDYNKTSFIMHDLMNDLAKSVSEDFCFRLEDNRSFRIPDKARHFSFSGSQCDASETFNSIQEAKLLRTILPFDLPPDLESLQLTRKDLDQLFQALKRLRILSLSHYHIISLPKSFKGLKHLRYLDLSSTRLKELPEFVCSLCNLQTLLLSNCRSITKLPTSMAELINLRYLDVVGTPLKEMPTGISKLRNLQKLSNFVIGRLSGAGLHELKDLSHLRGTLEISELQNVAFANEARDASLRKKPFLDRLVLKWSAKASNFVPGSSSALACDQREVLKMLHPHPNLKMLSVESYEGATFPSWLGDPSFSGIVSVTLRSCSLCISLPPLGQLPSLKSLTIEKFNILQKVGPEFFFGDNDPPLVPFQSLHTLKFYGMPRWEEWACPELEGELFPSLQKLIIQRCPNLIKEFPNGLPSSIEVSIIDCPLRRGVSGSGISVPEFQSVIPPSPASSRSTSTGSGESSSTKNPRPDATSSSHHGNDETDVPSPFSFHKEAQLHREHEEPYEAEHESSSHHSEEVAVISARYSGYISDLTELHSMSALHHSQSSLLSHTPAFLVGKSSGPGTSFDQLHQKVSTQSPDSSTGGSSSQKMRPSPVQDETDFDRLKVTEISQLMELPQSLQSLQVERCEGLISLPEGLMGRCPNLQELFIVECHSLESFPGGHPPTTLKTIYLRDCKKLEFTESLQTMHTYSQLEYLFIGSSCNKLRSFPLSLFPRLKSLSITDCQNFGSFWIRAGLGEDRIALEALQIRDCPNLETFPPGGLPTPKLASMLLSNCKNLRTLPEKLFGLTSLQSVFINDCSQLETIPGGGFPRSLRTLCISRCEKLTPRIDWGLRDLRNLQNLEIEGGNDGIEPFPEEGLLPKGLFSLRISEFQNLTTLNQKGFQELTALEMMEMNGFEKLQSLPEEGLPCSLSCLRINRCPMLTELLSETETERYKISNIPHVEIDGEVFEQGRYT